MCHSEESKSCNPDRVFGKKKTKCYGDENSRTAAANFLLFHDERYKVPQTHPIYHTMGEEALKIVKDTFDLIDDDKFQAKILPSGSFFEDLKVGKPDEFDFLAQITSLSGKKCDVVPSDRPGFVHVTVDESVYGPWKKCMALVCSHRIRADQCKSCGDIDPSDTGCTIVLAPEKVQEEFREIVDNALEDVVLPKNWRYRGIDEPEYSGFRRHGPANMFLFYYITPDGQSINISLDVTLSIGLSAPVDTESTNFFPMDRIPKRHRFQSWYRDVLEKGVEGEFPLQLIPLYSSLHVATKSYGYKDCWRVSCSLIEREFLNRFQPDTADSLPKRCIRLCKWLRDKYLTGYINKRKKKNLQDLNKSRTNIPEENGPGSEDKAQQTTCANTREKENPGLQTSVDTNFRKFMNQGPEVHVNAPTRLHEGRHHPDRHSGVKIEKELSQLSLTDKEVRETHTVTEHGGETTTNPDYKTLPETDHKIDDIIQSMNFVTDADIPGLLKNFKEVFKPPPSKTDLRSSTFRCVNNIPVYSNRVSLKSLNDEKAYVPYINLKVRSKKHKERRLYLSEIQRKEVSDMQLDPQALEDYGPKAFVTSIEIKYIVLYLMERHPFPDQWTENEIPVIIIEIFKLILHMYLENSCMENFFFRVPVTFKKYDDIQTAILKLDELIDKMDSDWIPIREEFPRTNFTDKIPRFGKLPPRLESMAMKLCRARPSLIISNY